MLATPHILARAAIAEVLPRPRFILAPAPNSHLLLARPTTAWLSSLHHGLQNDLTLAERPLRSGTQLPVAPLALWANRARKETTPCHNPAGSPVAP